MPDGCRGTGSRGCERIVHELRCIAASVEPTRLGNALQALSPIVLVALSWLSLRVAALINATVKNERCTAS